MGKTQSKRSASESRPPRRSLVELTEALSRAVDDGGLATSAEPMAAADQPPRSQPVAKTAVRSEAASSDSAAEMMVKIAKDYQSKILDNVRNSMNAALDQAKDFAETRRANEREGDAGSENNLPAALGAATAVYRAKALELMQANFANSLSFARELAGARTAAEFVELSGVQARKSCEMMLKQADALKSLAETVAKERADRE